MSHSDQRKRLADSEATIAWGHALAGELQAGDVIALVGDLGAGKTHASKGIVAGLGSDAGVSSPTFTLVHEYTGGRLPVFHFDFYRLDSAEQVIGIGWDDYLDAAGVVIVEWADRYPELMPPGARWFLLKATPDAARTVEPVAAPAR